ncbi:hypothetical protein TVAG_183700 [Trichomonas vaginalis G3]|uniref:CKK domain-containing protein n=1 Tax=Trichomonas vaginalis (strain ATCC PRA-98 / G3) TaxID=412133 RepID=A2D9A7_TRIV3|nr:CKK domain domain-containing protein [Trichomonas vaginalis G3]EAY23133.1 hypothetical protein TVAG_183700 [Trichomonas vaginalis G3]KAI5513800.1 CKK domain domain-containing protein [Trichomonas vaginalis G3]|eukprot:XP_001584119.1 hypothetical protein [Trichomonas vaginalis G3]
MSKKTPSPKSKTQKSGPEIKEKIVTISPTKDSSEKRIKKATKFLQNNENFVFPAYRAETGFSATFSMLSTSNSSINADKTKFDNTLVEEISEKRNKKNRSSSMSPNKVQLSLELTNQHTIISESSEEEEGIEAEENGLKIGGVISLIQNSENNTQEFIGLDSTQIEKNTANKTNEDNSTVKSFPNSPEKSHESALIFVPIETPQKKHKVMTKITLHLSPNYSKVIAAIRNLFEDTSRNGEHVEIGRAMTKEPRRHFLIYLTSPTELSGVYVVKKNQLNLIYGNGPSEIQFADIKSYFVHNVESKIMEKCIEVPYVPTDACIAFLI